MEDGLLEGFEVGGLGGLKRLQGTDFFGERIELFDDRFLLREWRQRDFEAFEDRLTQIGLCSTPRLFDNLLSNL